MTFQTLQYIHKPLVNEEQMSLSALKDARKEQYAAEDAQSPDAAQKRETADLFYKLHSEAQDALQDFENQDWR